MDEVAIGYAKISEERGIMAKRVLQCRLSIEGENERRADLTTREGVIQNDEQAVSMSTDPRE